MSSYSTMGITVSPRIAGEFLAMLRNLDHDSPDLLGRNRDGDVNAVFTDRNHFRNSRTYDDLMRFFRNHDDSEWIYEFQEENCELEVIGCYSFGFWSEKVYRDIGDPIDLDAFDARASRRRGGY